MPEPQVSQVSDEHRDVLGRRVREVEVAWAKRQPNPQALWMLPYDLLSEERREAYRCMGAALWGDGYNVGLEVGLRHVSQVHADLGIDE